VDIELQRGLADLREELAGLKNAILQRQPGDTSEDEVDRYAQSVLNDGVRLYEASVAEGSVIDASDAQNSVFGVAEDRIRDWSLGVRFGPPGSDVNSSTTVNQQDSFVLEAVSDQDDTGDASDDELDFEVAKRCIGRGEAFFQSGKYPEASATLVEGLKQLETLPFSKKAAFNVSDINQKLAAIDFDNQYKLATHVFETESPQKAGGETLIILTTSTCERQ
jgi:hypothetical protein